LKACLALIDTLLFIQQYKTIRKDNKLNEKQAIQQVVAIVAEEVRSTITTYWKQQQ
jgi:hypothetical protein